MTGVGLTDEQLVAFLTEGYLILQPAALGAADHHHLYRCASALYDEAALTRSPTAHLDLLGDNLRARIPELDALLTDPVVEGALQSVLGDDYITHPHSFCHRSSSNDQVFHQDGNLPWNERGHARVHRPDWALLFYYPQDVHDTNGPTEIVPHSQYWTTDHETDDGWHTDDRMDRTIDGFALTGDDLDARDRHQQDALRSGLGVDGLQRRFLHVPAGSVVLAHHDLVHRGSRTAGAPDPRFLYKFTFARVRSPRAPATVRAPNAGLLASAGSVPERLAPVVETHLAWLAGIEPNRIDASPTTTAGWVVQLRTGSEDGKVEAAYQLGRHAQLEPLREALFSDVESCRRAAGHGLAVLGEGALDTLLEGLRAIQAPIRRAAAAGLGTEAAAGTEAVQALIDAAATDSDDLVRSNAVYSLGQLARVDDVDATAIADALLARLAPGAEPDNATNAGLARSTVRQSAAHALTQVLTNHELPEDRLDQVVDGPLLDADRYVQGLIVEGLARASNLSAAQHSRLLRHLAARRWSHSPAPR